MSLMSAKKMLLASGRGANARVGDVFSVDAYASAGGPLTIVNGLNFAAKGGLVWQKGRTLGGPHGLLDTARGVTRSADTSTSNLETSYGSAIIAFNADGFTAPAGDWNQPSYTFAAWSFLKARKFFDVLLWNGDGSGARQISHALGIKPGMVIVKRRDANGDWLVQHRSAPNVGVAYPEMGGKLILNEVAVADDGTAPTLTAWSDTSITVAGALNVSGASYVAYLFAHDPAADGKIQCGALTTDGSGAATIALGWRPQYMLVKFASSVSDWRIYDTARGLGAGPEAVIYANLVGTEPPATDVINLTTTGFSLNGGAATWGAGSTIVYMAIREE